VNNPLPNLSSIEYFSADDAPSNDVIPFTKVISDEKTDHERDSDLVATE